MIVSTMDVSLFLLFEVQTLNYLVFNVHHSLTALPKSFGENKTCDSEEVECQFPFKYTTLSGESKNATKCTNDAFFEEDDNPDKMEEDFYWCATRVNADGTMKEGKWARCEESEACLPLNPLNQKSEL